MNLRHFGILILILIGLTLVIGFAIQHKSKKDLFLIGIKVTFGLFVLAGLIVGLAKLLVFLGIAEEGFVL